MTAPMTDADLQWFREETARGKRAFFPASTVRRLLAMVDDLRAANGTLVNATNNASLSAGSLQAQRNHALRRITEMEARATRAEDALRGMVTMYAARPDMAHLLGIAEISVYDQARAVLAQVPE
jgi:hypothetical protein